MIKKRINELFGDYENAVMRLQEALLEDPKKSSVLIDGTIQRFEFTFELAWKLMRAVLTFNGISADAPRSTIKEAFKFNLISDGNGWINMLEDRNQASHIYDYQKALEIYTRIKDNYFDLLKELAVVIKKNI